MEQPVSDVALTPLCKQRGTPLMSMLSAAFHCCFVLKDPSFLVSCGLLAGWWAADLLKILIKAR